MLNKRLMSLVLLSAVFPIGGCARKTPPAELPPALEVGPADQSQQRLDALGDQVRQLNELLPRLPGTNERAHGEALSQYFGHLSQILAALAPSSGATVQRRAILDNAQRELVADSQRAIEPIVNTALRAAHGGVLDAAAGYDVGEQVASKARQLNSLLEELDIIRGATHRLVAAQAARLTAEIVTTVFDAHARRVEDEIAMERRLAAPAPAVPATAPATGPAATRVSPASPEAE